MSWQSVAIRVFLGLAFAFWAINVLAVAVFAVGDRYSGVEMVFMSLVVLIGGFSPVAFLVFLFRDRLFPPHDGVGEERVRITGTVLPAHSAPREIEAPIEALSERELEVLTLVDRGLSNKEIAAQLSVTVGTVKSHTNNINRKLGSRTRTQALARARQHGLL